MGVYKSIQSYIDHIDFMVVDGLAYNHTKTLGLVHDHTRPYGRVS